MTIRLLSPFAPTPITLYILQDANFNVVALPDEYGRLAAQYTYLPYGKVRTAELLANPSTGPPGSTVAGTYWFRVLAAASTNRLGHQGLPVERLDPSGPWSHPMGSDGTLPWNGVSNSALLGGLPPTDYAAAYHSRNRLYAPDLGRFLSSDPNGTGLPTLDSMSFGGMGISVSSINPDYQSHNGDGMNSHAAYGGNPLSRMDALGLSIDNLVTLRLAYASAWAWLSSGRLRVPAMSRAGDYASVAAGIGQIGGAFYAAWMFGDSLRPDRNDALAGIIISNGGGRLAGLVGSYIGGRAGGNGPNMLGGWLGNAAGAAVAGTGFGLVQGDSAYNLIRDQSLGILQSGLGLVKGAAQGYLSGISFAVGMYDGMLEYAADSAFNWW